jgi:small conductance mechanosensitive channel
MNDIFKKIFNYFPEEKVSSIATSFTLALVTLVVGFIVTKWLSNLFSSSLKLKKIDETIRKFLVSLLSAVLKLVVFLSVLGILGVETTSFIALLGSAGLAIGLALQGSLSNLAGGFLIIVIKPFKVGDFIETQEFSGTVDEINIFVTKLRTEDNKVVLLPNGPLANGPIVNYTGETQRRVETIFSIGYQDDIQQAKKIIEDVIIKNLKIVNEPAFFIGVIKLAESSVDIVARVWVKTEDYWEVYFSLLEKVKLEFDKNKITIPFPQREIHIKDSR